MRINWSIRWKNPLWWSELLVAVFAPILTHAGINWPDITTWAALGQLLLDAVKNPVVVVAVVVAAFNAVTDPTTPGIGDSDRALTYSEPGK